MSEANSILITDLMRETEQFLIANGYKKGTLGTYKATWNRFLSFSSSEYYCRKNAEAFLRQYFGVDVNSDEQKLDTRMRHALRHMNSLEDFYKTGQVPRKRMRRNMRSDPNEYERFFKEYIEYCNHQNYSASCCSNTKCALQLFLSVLNNIGIREASEITPEAVTRFAELILSCKGIGQNTRRSRTRKVSMYLKWLYDHKQIDTDYRQYLPNIKRTPQMLPEVWSESDIQKLLNIIDTSNPTGKRNYAIFLLLARTGLRISDVVTLSFSNIDWRKNSINIVQQKTGKPISIPLSVEIGEAIISYLKHGRPKSDSDVVFLSHTAPYQPLNHHNHFHSEMRKYMRLAGVDFTVKRHSGVHTIRATFATNMLKNGATLESISQALGHSHINMATRYLQVDTEQLRICSLGLEVAR